eukprot:c11478_g1_i2.p2 GENE.c11478_g1_i2~~c11478_g1_i2.p2  ORF type:complete len:113 (+),score=15.21 c11478_g1_i2:224-562(+)
MSLRDPLPLCAHLISDADELWEVRLPPFWKNGVEIFRVDQVTNVATKMIVIRDGNFVYFTSVPAITSQPVPLRVTRPEMMFPDYPELASMFYPDFGLGVYRAASPRKLLPLN